MRSLTKEACKSRNAEIEWMNERMNWFEWIGCWFLWMVMYDGCSLWVNWRWKIGLEWKIDKIPTLARYRGIVTMWEWNNDWRSLKATRYHLIQKIWHIDDLKTSKAFRLFYFEQNSALSPSSLLTLTSPVYCEHKIFYSLSVSTWSETCFSLFPFASLVKTVFCSLLKMLMIRH